MKLRKLARLCEHDEIKAHSFLKPGGHPESSIAYGDCPGGVFLPDDTLVIAKVDGEWQLPPRAWLVLNAASSFGVPSGSISLLDELADALSVRETE